MSQQVPVSVDARACREPFLAPAMGGGGRRFVLRLYGGQAAVAPPCGRRAWACWRREDGMIVIRKLCEGDVDFGACHCWT